MFTAIKMIILQTLFYISQGIIFLHVECARFYEINTHSLGKRVIFWNILLKILQKGLFVCRMTWGHYSTSKNDLLSLFYGVHFYFAPVEWQIKLTSIIQKCESICICNC